MISYLCIQVNNLKISKNYTKLLNSLFHLLNYSISRKANGYIFKYEITYLLKFLSGYIPGVTTSFYNT